MTAPVTFHHPLIPADLHISVKPDQVVWAYGLNTQSYPTYGGEVVQILSVYFDDMTISGTVSSYTEMETIYSWFIAYMQFATQGRDHPSYDQRPVTFYYPERQWQFNLWPKTLPGFRYGRDVVAPTWSLTAAVTETSDGDSTSSLAELIKQSATFDTSKPTLNLFGKATADFGTTGDLQHNPFASPDGDPTRAKNQTLAAWASQLATQAGDSFNKFLTSYNASATLTVPDFSSLQVSQPASHTASSPATKQKHGGKTKK